MRNKLLIVEDDSGVMDMLASVFEREFEIHTAENGVAAYDRFFQVRPNIIVTDIMMPKMDGADLTKRIKLISPSTTIFAVSGAGGSKLELASSMGANGTFEKPGEIIPLMKAVKNLSKCKFSELKLINV